MIRVDLLYQLEIGCADLAWGGIPFDTEDIPRPLLGHKGLGLWRWRLGSHLLLGS